MCVTSWRSSSNSCALLHRLSLPHHLTLIDLFTHCNNAGTAGTGRQGLLVSEPERPSSVCATQQDVALYRCRTPLARPLTDFLAEQMDWPQKYDDILQGTSRGLFR